MAVYEAWTLKIVVLLVIMSVFRRGALRGSFGDPWTLELWDAPRGYRSSLEIHQSPPAVVQGGTNDVDFSMGLYMNGGIYSEPKNPFLAGKPLFWGTHRHVHSMRATIGFHRAGGSCTLFGSREASWDGLKNMFFSVGKPKPPNFRVHCFRTPYVISTKKNPANHHQSWLGSSLVVLIVQ